SQSFWQLKDGKVKVAAGMLMEHAGFIDYHDETTGMATWKTQGLVLVNKSARSAADLFAFRDKIIATCKERYNITLEQEPETITYLLSLGKGNCSQKAETSVLRLASILSLL